LTAIRLAEAQLAVPSGEALPAFLPSHVTRFSPSIAHKFRRGTRIFYQGRLQWGAPVTAQDRLEPGHGSTYQLRMPVRLLRQIFSVLLVVAYVSATILTAAPGANAAPPAMADGMMMMMTGQTGDAMPMPCSKGMKSSCVGDFGCVFMVSLPAAHFGVATRIAWSAITYTVADNFLGEHSIKPALGPPISRI
jgi:hypothetical protein